MSGHIQAPAALPPGKEPLVPIGYEAEWAPEVVVKKKIPTPYRDSNPQLSSAVPQSYTGSLTFFFLCRNRYRGDLKSLFCLKFVGSNEQTIGATLVKFCMKLDLNFTANMATLRNFALYLTTLW
jgi:hypothetical protein